jgi:hypothetical protein
LTFASFAPDQPKEVRQCLSNNRKAKRLTSVEELIINVCGFPNGVANIIATFEQLAFDECCQKVHDYYDSQLLGVDTDCDTDSTINWRELVEWHLTKHCVYGTCQAYWLEHEGFEKCTECHTFTHETFDYTCKDCKDDMCYDCVSFQFRQCYKCEEACCTSCLHSDDRCAECHEKRLRRKANRRVDRSSKSARARL